MKSDSKLTVKNQKIQITFENLSLFKEAILD